jgi:hypothetical protein
MADNVNDLKQQLQELNDKLKEAGGLGINITEAFNQAGNSTVKLNKYITEVKKRLSEITDDADYIYQTFKNIGGELANQNTLLATGKKSFQSLTSVAQNLNYYQKGNNDLSEKQFKNIKNSIGLHEKELQYAARQLEISTKNNKDYAEQLQTRLVGGEKLSTQEKNIIKNYEKELALLDNISHTLENNIIGKLKDELKISKEISDVRRDIGGIAVSTAKVLSTYAGPLASFLNATSAIEAVDDFSKRQVERALSSEAVQNNLLEIEKKKFEIQKEAAKEIQKINKLNISQEDKDKQITEVKAKESKDILKQEQESVRVRRDAIKSTDNLANRFKALGIAMGELGKGLLKAFTDPVTIIGLLIKLFKRAIEGAYRISQNVTNVGRALGVSSGLSGQLAGNMISSAKAAGGIFISAKNAVAAIQQLTDSLGIAVQFTGEEIALQVQLTELMGLSADEAARFNKISALTKGTTAQYVTNIQKGAFAAMRSNKVHLSEKQVLQEVSKLSAGILVKFQGNPKALGAAVVEAKKLGISLDKLEGISESLLDFQSSIEAELQAELLTGKQLNLEQARYAALTGNQADLMREIAKEAGSYKEFSQMNVLAQKSLAQAMGMSRDEMSEMLLQQEMAGKYGDEAAKLNSQELKDLERSGLTLDKYLAKQKSQLSLQEQSAATQERLAETLDNVLAPLGTQLIGIMNNLQQLLIVVVEELLGGVTNPMASVAEKIKYWTQNTDKFREKIREVKTAFKENLDLIKNIAIALAGLWVISKALLFFRVLRTGFLGLKPLISGLGLNKLFSAAPKVTPTVPTPTAVPTPTVTPTTITSSRGRVLVKPTTVTTTTRGGQGVKLIKKVTPTTPTPTVTPTPTATPAQSAAKGFTLKSGKSFLQGGKAYSVKTGGVLQGAAKTSVIKSAAKQVFVDPIKNIGPTIQNSLTNAGKSIQQGAANFSKGIQSIPKTVGTGLTNTGKSIQQGAVTLGKNIKNIPSNLAIRGITTAAGVKESLKVAASNPLQALKGAGNFTKGVVTNVGKGLASPITTVGKTVLKGGASGALSGIFGAVEGFFTSRSKIEEARGAKLKAIEEEREIVLQQHESLSKQLSEGKISQAEFEKGSNKANELLQSLDTQKAAEEKRVEEDRAKNKTKDTGTSVGAGLIQGGAAALGAGIGSALGPVGTMIGGYLGNSVGKWINEKAPGVAERFGKFWENISGKFTSALEPWKEVIENVKEKLDTFLKGIGFEGGLGEVLSGLAEGIGESLLYPFKVIIGLFGWLADTFKALGQLLTGDFKGAWETIKKGFLDLMETVFSPLTFIFDKVKLGWAKIKSFLPWWLGGDDKSEEAAANAPQSKTSPAPSARKMATGGVVTRSGMAEVDQGEVYLGRNTKDSFSLMVAASQRQLNALMVLEKALIDVKNEVKNMTNKPAAPVVLTLDGKQITKQISSRPEMQVGLGKSRVMLS